MLSIFLILLTMLGPVVYTASKRNEYQRQKIFLGSRAQLVCEANTLTAFFEPFA
jgi:hypothetical protein